MKAPFIVLVSVLTLVSPALAQSPAMSKHMELRKSKRVARMRHHRYREDQGVSVVAGSAIKRDAVGEVMAPQVPSVTSQEKAVVDSPDKNTPAGTLTHP